MAAGIRDPGIQDVARRDVGIQDVARRAEVSIATASRALRGMPRVAPATRARVVRAAAELDYVAHPQASRLAMRRTGTIGVVVPVLGSWYYARTLAGIDRALAVADLDLLPFNLSRDRVRERFVSTSGFRKRVDGLVLVDVELDDDEWSSVLASAVPLVGLGIRHAGVDSLTIDDAAAARLAVDHLVGLGHVRIAVITATTGDDYAFRTPVGRLDGYLGALDDAGIPPSPEWVVSAPGTADGGAEAMRHLLDLDEPPTAVHALSDEMAIGALAAARDAGLDVPRDLSVVGFDDHEVAAHVGLTTIRQDVVGHGEAAVRVLLGRVDGAARPPPVQHTLGVSFVPRNTTGPAP